MRTSNGLNVPTGWGQRRPESKRPCPLCFQATQITTNAAGFKVLADHTRQVRGVYGRSQCPGSGRLVD